MKRIMLVIVFAGLALAEMGYLYLVHTIRAEERRAFVPFKQMAKARAVTIQKHRDAVRQAALNEVQKEIQEQAGGVIHDVLNQAASLENFKSRQRVWEFCIDMLNDSLLSRDGSLQKIFGEASESELVASRVCAESAIRDAESYVNLSESFEKRP